MTDLPLKGLKVLSVEQYGAGPFCTQYLATFGADVVKIENRKYGGDVARVTGPYRLGEEDSLYFQSFNQGKRSLSLDLRQPEGQEVLHRLVAEVDVVANNARGDQPEKLGITFDQLKGVRPSIVCAHLSAYGRGTSREAWPGYDYLMQAEAGIMDLTGDPEGLPQRAGVSVIDFMTGMNQLFAIMAGVFRARETGQGSEFDVCLFDTALYQLTYPALWHLNEGYTLSRQPRSAHPDATPSQMVRTKDGHMMVMCQIPKFWDVFCTLVPTPGLTDNPAWATIEDRRAAREEISARMEALFQTRTTAAWLELLQGHMPVAPIKTMMEALASDFPAETGMVQEVSHPARAEMRVLSNPIHYMGNRVPARPGPTTVGADTDAILAQHGFAADEVATLREKGVI